MLRRIFIALAIALVGLFVATNSANAAPTPYPPPPAVSVAVDTTVVSAGGTVDFTGSGYLPGELITITVYYRTASGALVYGGTYTVRADANGNFSIPLTLTQAGMAILTAVGQTSGRTATLDVSVGSGTPTSEGTTTVPPNETVTSSGISVITNTNTPATSTDSQTTGNGGSPGDTNNGEGPGNTGAGGNPGDAGNAPDAGGSGVRSGGLAYTGASIAGPLTVGAVTLAVGLAILFFGTRLAIRRKPGSAAHR